MGRAGMGLGRDGVGSVGAVKLARGPSSSLPLRAEPLLRGAVPVARAPATFPSALEHPLPPCNPTPQTAPRQKPPTPTRQQVVQAVGGRVVRVGDVTDAVVVILDLAVLGALANQARGAARGLGARAWALGQGRRGLGWRRQRGGAMRKCGQRKKWCQKRRLQAGAGRGGGGRAGGAGRAEKGERASRPGRTRRTPVSRAQSSRARTLGLNVRGFASRLGLLALMVSSRLRAVSRTPSSSVFESDLKGLKGGKGRARRWSRSSSACARLGRPMQAARVPCTHKDATAQCGDPPAGGRPPRCACALRSQQSPADRLRPPPRAHPSAACWTRSSRDALARSL